MSSADKTVRHGAGGLCGGGVVGLVMLCRVARSCLPEKGVFEHGPEDLR